QVHVADQRLLAVAAVAGDEVLDEHTVFEHRDLDPVAVLAHHHRALHRLPPGQELGLGQDRAAPAARVAAVAAALALGLQPGGAAHGLHAVVLALVADLPRRADLDDGAVLLGDLGHLVDRAAAAATTATATGGAALRLLPGLVVVLLAVP